MNYTVHKSAYIDDNVTIGDDTKIWHFCHIQSGAVIGNNCVLGQNVNVSNNVNIGDNCRIQNNVAIYEGVTIASNVFCGPSVVFTNDLTPRAKLKTNKADYKKTYIGYGASLCANSTIVCGNNVGKFAMVGAGCVVTHNVNDYSLVVGVPARHIGYVCECGERLSDSFRCDKCGKSYHLEDKIMVKDGV